MIKTITITLAGKKYTLSPFTLGQRARMDGLALGNGPEFTPLQRTIEVLKVAMENATPSVKFLDLVASDEELYRASIVINAVGGFKWLDEYNRPLPSPEKLDEAARDAATAGGAKR
jgi:hypothetical protein